MRTCIHTGKRQSNQDKDYDAIAEEAKEIMSQRQAKILKSQRHRQFI
jgi:hypothetical protein